MRRAAAIPAVLACLVASGCGASSSGEDSSAEFRGAEALVASAVEDLESAAREGDEGEICGQLLAGDLVDRLSRDGRDCRATVRDALEAADTADLTVADVRIAGATATARVSAETGDRDRVTDVRLVRERGRWKIAGLPGGPS